MLQSQAPIRLLFVVAAILIDDQDRILLAQRPEGKALAGLWEFPGGKVDVGERPEDALVRELREELGIVVSAADLKPTTFASHAYADFHLMMPLWRTRIWHGEPRSQEGQKLAWVPADRLGDYAMPPADVPLVDLLQALQANHGLD